MDWGRKTEGGEAKAKREKKCKSPLLSLGKPDERDIKAKRESREKGAATRLVRKALTCLPWQLSSSAGLSGAAAEAAVPQLRRKVLLRKKGGGDRNYGLGTNRVVQKERKKQNIQIMLGYFARIIHCRRGNDFFSTKYISSFRHPVGKKNEAKTRVC